MNTGFAAQGEEQWQRHNCYMSPFTAASLLCPMDAPLRTGKPRVSWFMQSPLPVCACGLVDGGMTIN